MTEQAIPNVSKLVETFERVVKPAPGDTVDMEAAKALLAWLRHPYVCSGGTLSDAYVPPYLAALVAEVERLRAIIDEAAQVYGNAIPCGNVCTHFDCRALHVLRSAAT